jgi:hypothetical protein
VLFLWDQYQAQVSMKNSASTFHIPDSPERTT